MFSFGSLPAKTGTIDTGDYSVRGLEHLIAVERKRLDDLLASRGGERDRFKRELQRLRAYQFRLPVVETDAETIEAGEWRSKLRPSHVLGSLAALTAQYGLPVLLSGPHEACGRFVERYLYLAARSVAGNYAAASALIDRAERGVA